MDVKQNKTAGNGLYRKNYREADEPLNILGYNLYYEESFIPCTVL